MILSKYREEIILTLCKIVKKKKKKKIDKSTNFNVNVNMAIHYVGNFKECY